MRYLLLLIFIYILDNSSSQINYPKRKLQAKETIVSHLNLVHPIFQPFIEEWERTMPNFYSQYMYSIPVKYKTKVDYYENITKVPCLFQGAFIFDEAYSERDSIEFTITAPNTTVIYKKFSIASIFSLNLTDRGLYTISFNNMIVHKEMRPILFVNSGQNLILGKESLSETEKKLDSIITFLHRYDQDIRLMRGFKRRGSEDLAKTNNYFYAFSVIETIILIGVTIWQYFYLKHLFEIKGSL